ncbi:MAG: hypothetical protein NUK65_12645, partial [Firmicutes bacterium]|nr:hypothetical protein [Bacillota bacterium]
NLMSPHESACLNGIQYPISGSYTGLRVASDQQGHFSFKNLVPGRYGLGFVINLDEVGDVVLKGGRFPQSVFFVDAGEVATWDFELVETVDITAPVDDEVIKGDSITFAWEPVEGASYYRLELGTYIGGGSRSYSRGEKYRTNSATIGVDTLQSYHVGLSYDEKGPSPGSLLGYGMRGRYFWGVTAYDEAGAIITSSQGYLQAQNSDFQFPEEKTVAGDELLLERKYGQAITAYQEQLDKDDNDIHALTMLARLHSVTIDSQIYDYQYTDYAQAITYYNQLFTQTGNTEFLHSLTQIYFYNLKEYPLALETLQKIEERDVLNEWNQLQMAQIQSHLGQYQTALQTVIAAERRFFTEEAALRIITGDFSSIAEKAKSNKEEKWLDAMQVVARGYGKLDQELLQVVRNLPALEAIEYLETKERTREEELLLLSLLAVEPSTLVRAQEQLEDYAAMNIEQSPAWVTSVRILLQTIQ